jgi:hypothetical protein
MRTFAAGQWAVRNWFLIVFPLLLLASLQFKSAIDWQHDGATAEAVLLFDLCVTMPFLYFLCYRKSLSLAQLALRLLGLACFGVWFATWLVPADSQSLLPHLGWARIAGIAVIILVELRVLIAAIRISFSRDASAQKLIETTGAPRLIAKLMMLEAKFWHSVWRLIKGR